MLPLKGIWQRQSRSPLMHYFPFTVLVQSYVVSRYDPFLVFILLDRIKEANFTWSLDLPINRLKHFFIHLITLNLALKTELAV